MAGMTEFLAPITLAPAKPYEGKAQTSAVGAAVRKMIDAGWAIAPSRWPDVKAQVHVRGHGHLMLSDDVSVPAATVSFLPGDGVSFDDMCAELRAAGWLVFPRKANFVQDGTWLSAEVTGPGVNEWAAERETARAAAEVRKVAEEAAQADAAARLKTLLAEHDITALVGHVSDYADSVKVPYGRMIELIEKLTARP